MADKDVSEEAGGNNQNGQNRGRRGNALALQNDAAFSDFMSTLQEQVSNGVDVSQALKFVLEQRSKSLDFYGKVMAFFSLCSLYAFYKGSYCLAHGKDETYMLGLDLFTYLLPFVSFIIDPSVRRAYNIRAKPGYVCFKIIYLFIYLLIYVMALQSTGANTLYWISSVDFFVFPIFNIIYWIALLNKKLQ